MGTVDMVGMGTEDMEGMAMAEEDLGMGLLYCWVLACLLRWCCLVVDSGSMQHCVNWRHIVESVISYQAYSRVCKLAVLV